MKKRVLILLFFLLSSWNLFAQTNFDNLSHYLNAFQTLTANFVQTVLDFDGTVLQRSTGKLAILRPGKFYWDIQKPLAQTIISNGKTLWIYDKDLAQVTVRKLDQSIGQVPMLLLTHSKINLTKTCHIQSIKRDQFKLTPKFQGANFQYVILSFQHSKLFQMAIFNQLNQKTNIQFSDVKLNSDLKSSMFEFKPPKKGIDVIKSL